VVPSLQLELVAVVLAWQARAVGMEL
jgi:hypothetical protein